MDERTFKWYFLVPLLMSASLISMYFSGRPFLETLVAAPYFREMPWHARREFGLLENLQNFFLLAAFVMAFRAGARAPRGSIKLFHASFAAILAFLLLEELDYGVHLLHYLGWLEMNPGNLNLHNAEGVETKLKTLSSLGVVLGFGVAPFFRERFPPKLRPLLPERGMLLILGVALLTRTAAHALGDMGLGHGLQGNLSEFRELIMYYLLLAYAVQVSKPPIST